MVYAPSKQQHQQGYCPAHHSDLIPVSIPDGALTQVFGTVASKIRAPFGRLPGSSQNQTPGIGNCLGRIRHSSAGMVLVFRTAPAYAARQPSPYRLRLIPWRQCRSASNTPTQISNETEAKTISAAPTDPRPGTAPQHHFCVKRSVSKSMPAGMVWFWTFDITRPFF